MLRVAVLYVTLLALPVPVVVFTVPCQMTACFLAPPRSMTLAFVRCFCRYVTHYNITSRVFTAGCFLLLLCIQTFLTVLSSRLQSVVAHAGHILV